MSYELRPITADDVQAFRTAITMGFGNDYNAAGDERFLSLMPFERTVAAFDGDEVVGTLGDFDLQLTVPGGTQVAMAGTTMVTVKATHTRRGILRSMIQNHLDNAVSRGESVAGLWASEPGIYGRFGFGLASECHEVKIDGRHLTKPVPATDVQISMIPAEKIPEVIAPYWHKVATNRSGFIDRGEPRWQDIMNDPEANRGGGTSSRHIVARRGGHVVGYLDYRQHGKWDNFVAAGLVSINTMFADDLDAHLALWAYALNVDLFPNVEFWNGAIDDPLAYTVSEARAVRRTVGDALYVRVLDVEAALSARTYEHDGEAVFTIVDDMGYAGGTYKLVVHGGNAEITTTDETAAITMGIRELGALYLGRDCAGVYATTGDIEGGVDAIRALGRLFVTARAPWCPEMF